MPSNPSPTLCEACAQLGTMQQATDPHSGLLDRGSKQLSHDGAVEQLFRCADCDTIWLRHINKWGMEGAFRLASHTPAPG